MPTSLLGFVQPLFERSDRATIAPTLQPLRAVRLHVIDHQWLARVRRVISPNADERPSGAEIELVVIHCISLPPGEFGTGMVEKLFTNTLTESVEWHADPRLHDLQGIEVSSHLFIDRKGRATQFVPFHQRAWHAGASSWRGRARCNDFSIGIELEGTEERLYTAAQYRRLGSVIRALFVSYPRLGLDSLVGHSEIAPQRKTDPGPSFDWSRLFANACLSK